MANLVERTLLKRYYVNEFLGRGGMAEVYRAWDAKRSVFVALKVLNEDLAEDYVFLRRFAREARALELLQHPHIVRFFGFEEAQDSAFLVMEYIDGSTLRRHLKLLGRPLAVPEALAVLQPVCSALHYAHGLGVYHCDVKPANIFIERGGRVVLGDFGIARLSESATVTFSMPGTPAYMAPEQCQGEEVDARTDVYSLGITTYEMLTLDRPFKGDTQDTPGSRGERVRWEQVHVLAPAPGSVNPAISSSAESAILKALEKDPKRRHRGALEFYRDLSGAGAVPPVVGVPWVGHPRTLPAEPPQPPSPPPPGSQEDRAGIRNLLPAMGRGWLAMGIFGVVLVLCLLALIFRDVFGVIFKTPTPTPTVTLTQTGAPTLTPPSTHTPTPTQLGTLTPAPTPTRTAAPTQTGTPTPTSAPSRTPTPTQTNTPTSAPTGTPTPTSPYPPGVTGWIVFTRNPHGHQDSTHEIYVLELDSGNLRRLTNNSVVDWDPAWSPDGEWITFVSYQLDNYDIWVMRGDGGGQAARITLPAWDDYPVWSPDGSQIAIASTGITDDVANSEIFIGRDTGSMRQVTFNTERDEWPSWAPDGQWLACSSDRDGDMDIYLFTTDGGNIIQWTNDPAYDEQPAWSPDGQWLAFIRKTQDTDGSGGLARRDDGDFGNVLIGRRDGSEFRQLTYDNQAADPAWSPDGRYVVFVHAWDTTGDGRVGLHDASDLWAIPVTGGDPIPLTEGPEQDWAPDWTR